MIVPMAKRSKGKPKRGKYFHVGSTIVTRRDRSEGVLRVYLEARLPMAGEKGGRKHEANKVGWER